MNQVNENKKEYTYEDDIRLYCGAGSTTIDTMRVNYIRLKNNILIVNPGYANKRNEIKSSDYVLELSENYLLFDFTDGYDNNFTRIIIGDPLVDYISFDIKKEKDEHGESFLNTHMSIYYPNPDALSEFGIEELSFSLNWDNDKYSINIISFDPRHTDTIAKI